MSWTDIQPPPGFKEIAEGRTRLVVRADLAASVCQALAPLRDPWSRIAFRRFTASGRAGVVSIPLEGGLPKMILRRYVHGGMLGTQRRDLYFGPDRALLELLVFESARRGGLRTPEPIGILATHAWGPFWRLALMTFEITDSEDLVHYCCRLNNYPPETAAIEKRGVIREAARQICAMHDLGIYHADLHLKNLLLRRRTTATPEVYIIDFDRATIGEPLPLARRLKNLKRLARSVRKVRVAYEVLTEWDKARFLREYVAGVPGAAALFRPWIKKLARVGKAREAWWALTGARRHFSGDRIGRVR